MNDFIEGLAAIVYISLFYFAVKICFVPGGTQIKTIDDFFIKSEEKLKLINEEKQQLMYDYRKKHAENGIILLGNYPLKKDFNLSKFINESFADKLKDIGFHEYLYLTGSSKNIDIPFITYPKIVITIGDRAEGYLIKKEINLESKSIGKIAVLLKIQKNKEPEIHFKLKQQV